MNAGDWFTVLLVFAISDTFAAVIAGSKLLRLHTNRLIVFVGILLLGVGAEGFAFMLAFPYRPRDLHYSLTYVAINILGRLVRSGGVWALVLYVTGGIRREGSAKKGAPQ